MKTINSEMKALVKSKPLYLMLLVCAEESNMPETTEAILEWEAENMPKVLEIIAQDKVEIPRAVKLISEAFSPTMSAPFVADDFHGMIDEFIARAEANPELELTAEEIAVHGTVRDYYTASKERFANV